MGLPSPPETPSAKGPRAGGSGGGAEEPLLKYIIIYV